MKFIADLHVHSKYSMATAKNLDLENLYIAAQLKGITVIGTGDATHPGWISEIKEKLVPAEAGLFRLKDEIASICDNQVPLSCRRKVRFVLVSEISNIYKKKNKTYKNHNLTFLPDLRSAERFNKRLDRIGNIKSDGRPILGLDARNLLEILLESSDDSFLIPAHIWTPWFSLLGSRSGFNSIEDCFEDLSPRIFAVETGLSSDPAMNWRVKNLDRMTLVSNSDAHSPMKLGREANIFDTGLNYFDLKAALQSGDPKRFLGTFEFYPEEGKYYLDGHRKCGVCLHPEETTKLKGICPVCGKPLTLGVMYRVSELADRQTGKKAGRSHPYYSIAPLVDLLSEIFNVGSGSKKVARHYYSALTSLGSEFSILHDLEIEKIKAAGIPLLAEAVNRMRLKTIDVMPGYDGEYGKIKIFSDSEREKLFGQKKLFNIPESWPGGKPNEKGSKNYKNEKAKTLKGAQKPKAKTGRRIEAKGRNHKNELADSLNKEQQKAVMHPDGPMLIIAGPGTGKTRTLTHRIAYLIREKGIDPKNILALTFTIKAAKEMENRLKALGKDENRLPLCATFHSFSYNLLTGHHNRKNISIIDDADRNYLIGKAVHEVTKGYKNNPPAIRTISDMIVTVKQKIIEPEQIVSVYKTDEKFDLTMFVDIYATYQELLSDQCLCDYEDLIYQVVKMLESDNLFRKSCLNRFKFIFVDEYQDLNYGQYRMIRSLSPPHKDLCVIGDPDQSIYGFRGSDVRFFFDFVSDYPDASVFRLTRNYRSAQTILDASYQVLKKNSNSPENARIYSDIHGIKSIGILETGSEKGEAVAVGRHIENMIGGLGFNSIDFDKIDAYSNKSAMGFSDFAILYRTHRQGALISEVLEDAGIPCRVASRETIYNNKIVSRLLSFLKVIEGEAAFVDFERIVRETCAGIGKKSLEILYGWMRKNRFTLAEAMKKLRKFPIENMQANRQLLLANSAKRLSDMGKRMSGFTVEKKLQYLIDNTKVADTVKDDPHAAEALGSVISLAGKFDFDTKGFFTGINLHSDTDIYDQKAEKISLMTMHAAKGLEFPVVFITGCEDYLIPYKQPGDDTLDIDEEKRLFFVAMTRAKERLYLTHARKRLIFGRMARLKISPFVLAIEEHLRKHETMTRKNRKEVKTVQLKLF